MLALMAATAGFAGTSPNTDDTRLPPPAGATPTATPDRPAASAADPKANSAAPGDTTLELAPVKVTSTIKPEAIRKSEERPKAQLFTWKNGGTILKHDGHRTTTELKLQFNADHGGLDIISISR